MHISLKTQLVHTMTIYDMHTPAQTCVVQQAGERQVDCQVDSPVLQTQPVLERARLPS